ncbi:MAG: hypothetical protein I3274_02635 [Candidatus Moeniiplasma glomeromycotorum]|nr:hypothetical protein [Candidatus Moeniiplasma glomeromycotorum]MCE8167501.1 hypothetical protein [Candidatus Moeniiplasma glomeromycotorum]
MKFQFNLTTQTLKIADEDRFLILPEEWRFRTQFGGIGFYLNPSQPNHWINFTLTGEKIQAFFKLPLGEELVCYKREINRPLSGRIEVEFSEWDRIEKVKGMWVSRKGSC